MKIPNKNLGKDVDYLQSFLKSNNELFSKCYFINDSFIRNKKIKCASIQKRYFEQMDNNKMQDLIKSLQELKNNINLIVDKQTELLTLIKDDQYTQYEQN